MKAIILAAGMGTRLGNYTKNLPKGMLEFNGKPLIKWQIETLRKCNINNIIIVTGHKEEKISFPGIKYYSNKDYANTNMVESLFSAEEELNDDTLVCYADILYEKRIIEEVLKSNVDIGVVVDKDYIDYWKFRLDKPEQDTESLVIEKDKITELGETNCNKEKAKFRYVGLIKFSKKGLKTLKKVYHKNKTQYYDKNIPWLRSKSFKKAYMTCMLQAIINEKNIVKPIIISKGWLEFDTEKDYQKYSENLSEGTIKDFFSFKSLES